MPINAWATPVPPAGDTPVYPVQEINAYTVPPSGSPYGHTGWSPPLRTDIGSTPDPGRLAEIPLIDERPIPNRPPQDWYGPRDADKARRSAVEEQNATGWNEQIGADNGPRFAPNPRATPPIPTRITSAMSPNRYTFWRHMGTGQPKSDVPHALTGVHFSMADHRRNYPILGMQPQRMPGAGTRNTYRVEPVPWDANIVDYPPPAAQNMPYAAVQVPAVGTSLSRTGRLL